MISTSRTFHWRTSLNAQSWVRLLASVLALVSIKGITRRFFPDSYHNSDTLKLLDDVAELKPTLFASVPRLFNRIYDKIWAGVKAKGGIAEKLFRVRNADCST
jgi:long-subunit acyl-CoA synthetase (AMP-forming)